MKKSLLKFIYNCLLLPIVCLYFLPVIRMEVQKNVSDTLSYTSLEMFLTISYFVFGILIAVLAVVCLTEGTSRENMIILSIGCLIVLAGSYMMKHMVSNYMLFVYGLPYSALYLGVDISLIGKSFLTGQK
ncbi:MAG: hypothetical protein KH452_14350 [Clostridiales bacterium]|nr:hypothetical protein [Clostridiales bacterium]